MRRRSRGQRKGGWWEMDHQVLTHTDFMAKVAEHEDKQAMEA